MSKGKKLAVFAGVLVLLIAAWIVIVVLQKNGVMPGGDSSEESSSTISTNSEYLLQRDKTEIASIDVKNEGAEYTLVSKLTQSQDSSGNEKTEQSWYLKDHEDWELTSSVINSLSSVGSALMQVSTVAENKAEVQLANYGLSKPYAEMTVHYTDGTSVTVKVGDTTPDGSKAVKIAGSDYYAYGYDVAVAQKLADQMGMDLEVHKVEWSSIGISLDAGDYDCIIAGMGKTKEREASYAFTEPYYYRNNCIVVKKGGKYSNVKGLSDLADTGCKVTTQLGTGWIPLLDQIKGAEQSGNFETTSECFLAISNGSADVCVIDVPTAESAALTNDDLQIIELDENDTFTGDDEMVNVCIATRKDDTALRDKIQDAMNAIGWNDKAKMDELMDQVLTQQPAAN